MFAVLAFVTAGVVVQPPPTSMPAAPAPQIVPGVASPTVVARPAPERSTVDMGSARVVSGTPPTPAILRAADARPAAPLPPTSSSVPGAPPPPVVFVQPNDRPPVPTVTPRLARGVPPPAFVFAPPVSDHPPVPTVTPMLARGVSPPSIIFAPPVSDHPPVPTVVPILARGVPPPSLVLVPPSDRPPVPTVTPVLARGVPPPRVVFVAASDRAPVVAPRSFAFVGPTRILPAIVSFDLPPLAFRPIVTGDGSIVLAPFDLLGSYREQRTDIAIALHEFAAIDVSAVARLAVACSYDVATMIETSDTRITDVDASIPERLSSVASAIGSLVELQVWTQAMAINVGDVAVVYGKFSVLDPATSARALTDPAHPQMIVKPPNAPPYTVGIGSSLVRISQGYYYGLIPVTAPGTWRGRFVGDAPAQGTEPFSFVVPEQEF